jgi:hypothetical protein
MVRSVVPPALFFLLLAGCGPREPGPHEAEHGAVAYWEVTGTSVLDDGCTDDPAFTEALQPIELEENTFFIYKLASDGQTALVQDCTSTDASSCTDLEPAIELEVNGHQLLHDRPPETRPLDGTTCELELDEMWTFIDTGDVATLNVDLILSLVGDEAACAQIDADIRQRSPNGAGLDGCESAHEIAMSFYWTDFP